MPTTVPNSASRSRAPLYATVACLAVAVIAILILRGIDIPWSGKLGSNLYGVEKPAQLGLVEKYQRLVEVSTNVEDPARSSLKVRDWSRIGMCLSSTVVLALSLVGAATAWWWGRFLSGPPTGPGEVGPKMDRHSWILLGLLLVLGAALRWPAASQHPTYDEQDNMRRNYHGYLDFREPGKAPEWVEAGFSHAVWENERVNNPYFFSVLSQVSQTTWRFITGMSRERTDLSAMRFPSLLFGWLAIASVFWFARQIGLTRLAPIAAALMVVHGLALHHSVEARGYGLNLFMASLLLGFAWRALQIGRARDWFAFGSLVFLSVFSYPGSLYFVATVNLFVAATLLWRWFKQKDPHALTALARCVVANAAAGLLYLWIVSPAIPQAVAEFQEKFPQGNLGFSWLLGATVTYATGLMPIYDQVFAPPEWQGPTHVEWFFTHFPRMWPICLLTFVTLFFFISGWISLWKKGRFRAGFLLAAAGSGVLMVLHHYFFTGYSLFHWYIIYILPAVLLAWAAGIDSFAGKIGTKLKWRESTTASLLTAAICLWMFVISYKLPNLERWDDGITYLVREPPGGTWEGKSDPIRIGEIQRGSSLWVNTADGYLFRIRDYKDNPDQWNHVLARPLAEWGKVPGQADSGPAAP
ncbi:MAG: hypothetical protein ACKO2G_14575 [Verrucomicrobiales bacterium]